MSGKKRSIKVKILIVMLFLTVITFGLAAVLALGNINSLGHFTLKSCNKLGNDALGDSETALLKHAREELLSLAIGQAKIANIQLDRIEDELNMLTNLSERYLLTKEKLLCGDEEQRFLTIEEPKQGNKSRIAVFSKDSGDKYKRNLVRVSQVHPLLKFIYGNQHNLDMVYLCTSNGYYISYPWTELKKNYSPFKREWYKEAVKASGKIVWVGPYVSANHNRIIMTCAKAVKNFKGEIIAVCGLDITVKEITNSFIDMKRVHEGQAFLVDKDGNVLARQKMKGSGMQWHEDLKKENLFKSKDKHLREIVAKMVAGEKGVRMICGWKQDTCLPGGPGVYVAYAPVAITDWSIGVSVEADVLTAPAKKVGAVMKKNIQHQEQQISNYFSKKLKIYLATGVIILFLVLMWGIMFSHRVTAPIFMLKKKALKIAQGDFKSGIHLHTGDELERLDKTFDKMTKDISLYIQHVKNTVREREKTEQEFMVAANIQSLMLPKKFKKLPELKIDSYLRAAHEVSGDFYNYFMVDEKHLFFCIGKVSGKGTPAAMFMAQVMTLFSHMGATKIKPEKLLRIVNNTLVINNNTNMSVTAFCAYLNIESGKLEFSNAEHVPVVYIHEGEIHNPQTEKSLALGVNHVEEKAFKRMSLQLKRGDTLLFTVNGIDKVENRQGEIFGEKYLFNSFKDFKDADGSVIKFTLAQLKEFYGSQIAKIDVALLSIEYKGRDV